jgi:hypothetical protein
VAIPSLDAMRAGAFRAVHGERIWPGVCYAVRSPEVSMKVCLAIAAAVYAVILAGVVITAHGQTAAAAQPQDAAVGTEAAAAATDSLEVTVGFRIAPVHLTFAPEQRELVGLGSYIVNAQGGCNDCHTNPPYAAGHDPFRGEPKQVNAANYLAGGMHFGPFVSRNITPEANGRPAGLSFDQFLLVLRKGKDFDNLHPQISPLLQVMPWPVYGNMRLHHIRAIYTYLTAIPHAEPAP